MLEPGSLILQRYQLVRLIGRGGMGAVYEALDRRLRNTVALKQMLGDNAENAEAFEHEAQILAGLRHTALPKVIDYFRDPAGLFLVMEFFPGADLAALLARRGEPFPLDEVLGWADQLLRALEYLHSRQPPVLHRDIKPQNIKLTPEAQVVLLDFGLAKRSAPGRSASLFGYTLQYAPLEQIEASGTDPRSDLYAFGATLYHLLTNRPPPSALTRADALLGGHDDPLVPAHHVNAAVSLEVAQFLAQLVAVHREERFASATMARRHLRELASQATHTVIIAGSSSAQAMPGLPEASPDQGQPISVGWQQVRDAANAQAEPALRELIGTPRRPGPYLPELYVPREAIEAELTSFLAESVGALLILGDAGVGKTCLLADWAVALRKAGDAVLFYRCGGSLGPELDRELARDLGRDHVDLVLHDLSQIAHLAQVAQRRLVLIFDALNEYRGDGTVGPEGLLKQIDSLVGRVAGLWLRVVVSCNTATWGQLERAGATRLFWSAYYHDADGNHALYPGLFSEAELTAAYARYQAFFQLQTPFDRLPPALCERLARPLMLRLVAESSRGGPVAFAARGLHLGLFRRFYDERVRQRRDQLFVEELAEQLLRQGQTALPLRDLARNELLREALLSDEPDSTYIRLLDDGILTELSGDLFAGEMVSFAYAELGAYVLARHLLRNPATRTSLPTLLNGLMERARSFPLAFDIARTTLLIAGQPETFAALAQSSDIELRELVVQSLVELYADEPARGLELMKRLCEHEADESRRTALKAAYYIGPQARDLFLWAASRGSTALRRVARDTLYLTWHSDPGFTYDLLRELVARVRPAAIRDLRNIIEFFFELSVVIYINHPEREDVRDTTVELYYELARQRLHLDLLNTGMFGKTIEDLIFQAVASAFSQPILDTMLLTEVVPVEEFFAIPKERRSLLVTVAPLFDPATPLQRYQHELELLLQAENVFFNLVAIAQLAIHATTDFRSTETFIRTLYTRLPGEGRLWLLLSFCVLLPTTPPTWTPLIEWLTEQLFRDHPDLVYGETPGILQRLEDLLLLPLGLAYGKVGQTMPLIELMLQDGLLRDDARQVNRVVAGLAAVGFYYPEPVLRLLGNVLTASEHNLPATLIHTLATLRTLHLDAADVFMAQHSLSDDFQRQVVAATDTELVRRYIYWLGLYNQVVHSCCYYPKMRRQMAMAAMEMLTQAQAPQEFIGTYTATVFRMLREAGFKLSEWTTI
ncbi:protein kinase [Candidatus Chloroploca sp. Khr17]|uniref:protein kinase domain-containing protein n=1 Tax=Candidatus Chloroploca sp. Khr17 TaxID=2496869 RepID=UPI00101C0BA0|nr:serine/threonine-protein kinase [Candidatus Chloroploca sp. Khr17]